MAASGNRVVTFMGPMKMELQTFDYPKLITPTGKKANHGAILKVVTTNEYLWQRPAHLPRALCRA